MNQIYHSQGTSKQNMHQRLNHILEQSEEEGQLLKVMEQVREDHPCMGAPAMYIMLSPQTMGRDKFYSFYNKHNFKLKTKKNYRKTTNSNGVIRFENLLTDKKLTGVNQVFVSDITYYEIHAKFYYLTFIMDLYSRLIKGYSASASLHTTATTIPALQMAMKHLKEGEKPILHSDGGGQYYSKKFRELTEDAFHNSMCESVYENAHAERINGTIKNSYLEGYAPQSFNELKKMLKKAVEMYNTQRPHQSLDGLTPWQYEYQATTYPPQQGLLTKEKRSKKEKINNSNNFVKLIPKTVNLI